MKNIPVFLIFFFGMYNTDAQISQTKCPRNFDGKKLAAVTKDIRKHKGETVAFDAEVVLIKKGYNDKPYFEVKLATGETLWIASMITGNYVTIGRKLRLLGYIGIVANDDEIGNKYNEGGIQIRTFAILDLETKNLQISDAFNNEVKQWMDGVMPKNAE